MNIFILDDDPVVAAQYACNKHVVAMVRESAQIASTVCERHGHLVEGMYKPTHRNHPCTRWAGDTRENFDWLMRHGIALGHEYTRRYGRVHKSAGVLALISEDMPVLPPGGLTAFAQAMPEHLRGDDAVEAYRRFYAAEKASFAVWEDRAPEPPWWSAALAEWALPLVEGTVPDHRAAM